MAKQKDIETLTFSPIPDDVSPNDIVMVRNGFNGRLVYVSSKTGEKYSWDEYGDEVEMEIKELRTAKGSQKGFFEKNWFMFDEEYSWVIPYLGLSKYYEHTIPIEKLEGIVDRTPAEIKRICAHMTSGQKDSFTYMVRRKMADGEIDSTKTIKALEEGLGVSLSER